MNSLHGDGYFVDFFSSLRNPAAMSQANYPFRNRRPKRPQSPRPEEDLDYFRAVFAVLHENPERVERIVENLRYYQQQQHLPKSAYAAIKRFEYMLEVTQDVEEIEQWVMEDSYEGRKCRQLPLLFKGIR
ncbi:hypothetical protein ACR0ST_06285 [Aliidiomarina sp. Khilg15.8]